MIEFESEKLYNMLESKKERHTTLYNAKKN